MKTIVAFIVGLLIATAWAQKDDTHNIVWLPGGIASLNGHNYQTGLRHDFRLFREIRGQPPVGVVGLLALPELLVTLRHL